MSQQHACVPTWVQRYALSITGVEGAGYALDVDYRKGCGICSEARPCGAIEMTPETI